VFELIKETRFSHPSLCLRSLQALLDMLQGQQPEGFQTEPPDVLGKTGRRVSMYKPAYTPIDLTVTVRVVIGVPQWHVIPEIPLKRESNYSTWFCLK
jgi:hypothetical protein